MQRKLDEALAVQVQDVEGVIRDRVVRIGGPVLERLERRHAVPIDRDDLPIEQDSVRAVYHLYTVRTPRRDELQKFLAARGVTTMVHYPIPLHRQPVYQDRSTTPLPQSEAASSEVLSLPLFPEMTPDEQEIVIAAVRAFFGAPSA